MYVYRVRVCAAQLDNGWWIVMRTLGVTMRFSEMVEQQWFVKVLKNTMMYANFSAN